MKPQDIQQSAEHYADSFRLKPQETGWYQQKVDDFTAGTQHVLNAIQAILELKNTENVIDTLKSLKPKPTQVESIKKNQKVILKYSICDKGSTVSQVERNAPFTIKMFKNAEILTVQTQTNLIESHPTAIVIGQSISIPKKETIGKIWALCDGDADLEYEERTFFLAETGKFFEHNENTKYIGTYQVFDGAIVLHLFEITKK